MRDQRKRGRWRGRQRRKRVSGRVDETKERERVRYLLVGNKKNIIWV